jgi:hypothetical protein
MPEKALFLRKKQKIFAGRLAIRGFILYVYDK